MTRSRHAGIPGRRRQRQIKGHWTHRHIDMMESHAYRALSLSAHRCLSRIEIENAKHGGDENGELIVTYEHFIDYGVDKQAIGLALRELEGLGLIQRTELGVSGNAEARTPNKFRLTYHWAKGYLDPTHEWKGVRNIEEARAIAKAHRNAKRDGYRVKKQKPVGEKTQVQCRKPTLKVVEQARNKGSSPVGETHTTCILLEGHRTPRRRKLKWSKPSLVEIFPGPEKISALKSLYQQQALAVGDPSDKWSPPKSTFDRLAG